MKYPYFISCQNDYCDNLNVNKTKNSKQFTTVHKDFLPIEFSSFKTARNIYYLANQT